MYALDQTIARLRLLLAEIKGREESHAATRRQYEEQIARVIDVAVRGEAGLDRALAMTADLDARLHDLAGQERYLARIKGQAQRELESLQITKTIEEARAQIALLRQEQEQEHDKSAAGADRLKAEIRRLEDVIATASDEAARSIGRA